MTYSLALIRTVTLIYYTVKTSVTHYRVVSLIVKIHFTIYMASNTICNHFSIYKESIFGELVVDILKNCIHVRL